MWIKKYIQIYNLTKQTDIEANKQTGKQVSKHIDSQMDRHKYRGTVRIPSPSNISLIFQLKMSDNMLKAAEFRALHSTSANKQLIPHPRKTDRLHHTHPHYYDQQTLRSKLFLTHNTLGMMHLLFHSQRGAAVLFHLPGLHSSCLVCGTWHLQHGRVGILSMI